MKKIVVFGAGGFTGTSFIDEFWPSNKYDFIKVYHDKMSNRDGYCVDIESAKQVEDLIKDIVPDYIINLAGVNSILECEKNPSKAFGVNTNGSVNILEAVKQYSPNTKTLLIGTSEEYEDSNKLLSEDSTLLPRNIYGYSKLWQEQIAGYYQEKYSLKVVCSRSFNHAGLKQNEESIVPSFCMQAARIKKGLVEPVIFTGNLDIVRDIINVKDVVRAYMTLLESDIDKGIYNVCTGKGVNLNRLLEMIIGFTNLKVEVKQDPKRVRKVDMQFIVGDNSKIKKDTGWEPLYSIEDTLREIYEEKLKMI